MVVLSVLTFSQSYDIFSSSMKVQEVRIMPHLTASHAIVTNTNFDFYSVL
jgi:hypothetical protein